ncbi:MAG: RNA methyltransferase [Bacteroidetes bacterium]|nr:RNA methyltransferase [Bacteroidota bacterium]
MPSNAELKQYAALKLPKYRQKYGQFMVEGRKAVSEVFHSDMEVVTILATKAFQEKEKPPFGCDIISETEMKKLSSFTTPPGVVAIVKIPENASGSVDFNAPVILALDGISDPGNLGTIIRTADWYGVSHVLLSENCTDFYNPKCLAATMGSFIRVKPVYGDLKKLLTGKNVYGCYLTGENMHIHTFRYPAILLIGSESHGISADLADCVKTRVTIPAYGQAESLNAGIAAAVVLDRMVSGHTGI